MVKNVFIFTVFKVNKIQKTGQKPGKKYKYEKTNFKKRPGVKHPWQNPKN